MLPQEHAGEIFKPGLAISHGEVKAKVYENLAWWKKFIFRGKRAFDNFIRPATFQSESAPQESS